ncbi:hypothetical protein EMIT0P294_10127 [Pseudomonas sp. IT-P294]|jgi:hypothetical protein
MAYRTEASFPAYPANRQNTAEQGIIHMMTKRAEIEFLDAVSVYFNHATLGLAPDTNEHSS